MSHSLTHLSQPVSTSSLPTHELEALDELKGLIHRALEDGKITRQELNEIRSAALADGKLSAEECALYSSLILEKVKTGEIKMEW